MRCFKVLSLLVALVWSVQAGAADRVGDPERGAKLFKKCKACHQVGEGAKSRTGPVLNEIVGAAFAAVEGYKYSKPLKAAGAEGRVWTFDELDGFLTNPRKYIPKTRMSFRGLKKAADRADIIAFLATHTHTDTDAAVQGFSVTLEILAIEGDVEYGEYLSSECTACHQASGANDGIPAINALGYEAFVTAMHAYRSGHRTHQVMQLITGRLNDEEIAALAAYFETQE